jgi:hypothetical protein
VKTVILVRLVIEGEGYDASHVVDALLDAGFFQDAINDHDCDAAGPLHVVTADLVPPTPRQEENALRLAEVVGAPDVGAAG